MDDPLFAPQVLTVAEIRRGEFRHYARVFGKLEKIIKKGNHFMTGKGFLGHKMIRLL